MPRTSDLFNDLEPSPKPAAPAAGLTVSATQGPLSAAARAFELQLSRIDKLKGQLAELDAMEQSHRLAMHQQLTPLKARYGQCLREMVLLLDARLGGTSLSRLQRDTATEMLCGLAATLAEQGDADMAALHDKHSPQTLTELQQAESDQLRAQIEDVLGEALGGVPEGASVDDMLAAGRERLRQAQEAAQERRRAAAAKRKAKKKPSAAQAAAQAQLEDAETSLRKLFRQLASSLHPDREPDPQMRLSKTALMSEANAAYERRDLLALLQIQQKALGIDVLAAGQTSDEKLAGLTQLLKQQVAELERERAARSERLIAEFELMPRFKLNPTTLQMALLEQVAELEESVSSVQHDLQMARDDAGLKRWLNEQRRHARYLDRAARDMGFA